MYKLTNSYFRFLFVFNFVAKVILFSYMQAKNDIFFISSSKLAFRRVLPVVFFCRKSINRRA